MSTPETDSAAARAQELQGAFFSHPNLFRLLPQECPGDLAKTMLELETGLRRHAKGQLDRPILFPVRLEGEPRTIWFACAESSQQLRALEAELKGFVGPTYARFRLPEDGKFLAEKHAQPLLRAGGLRYFVMWTSGLQQDARLLEKWRM